MLKYGASDPLPPIFLFTTWDWVVGLRSLPINDAKCVHGDLLIDWSYSDTLKIPWTVKSLFNGEEAPKPIGLATGVGATRESFDPERFRRRFLQVNEDGCAPIPSRTKFHLSGTFHSFGDIEFDNNQSGSISVYFYIRK